MPSHQSQVPFRGAAWVAAAAIVLSAGAAWAAVVAASGGNDSPKRAAPGSSVSSGAGSLPTSSATLVTAGSVIPTPTGPTTAPTTQAAVTPPAGGFSTPPRPSTRTQSPGGSPSPKTTRPRTPSPVGDKLVTGAWYRVINQGNGRCVSTVGTSTKNGTMLLPATCGSSSAANWTFTATSSGYYRVMNRRLTTAAWDVAGWSAGTQNGNRVQVWTYANGTNQQWRPTAVGGGRYRFVARHSGKCLDTMGGAGFQQLTCSGSPQQTFRLDRQS
jgi:glucosylceramidase